MNQTVTCANCKKGQTVLKGSKKLTCRYCGVVSELEEKPAPAAPAPAPEPAPVPAPTPEKHNETDYLI